VVSVTRVSDPPPINREHESKNMKAILQTVATIVVVVAVMKAASPLIAKIPVVGKYLAI